MNQGVTVRSPPPANSSSEAFERGLLQRVIARDRAAMREFYLLYHRRLARFLRRLTLQPELIDEIVNDTMMIVWNCAANYRGDARVSTWVMGIAYRDGLKSLRSEQRSRASKEALDHQPELQGPFETSGIEQRDLVQKALATLSLEQRLVVEFTYFAGYSCEEIATIMECPANTVKTRLFYARDKLRGLLPTLSGGAV